MYPNLFTNLLLKSVMVLHKHSSKFIFQTMHLLAYVHSVEITVNISILDMTEKCKISYTYFLESLKQLPFYLLTTAFVFISLFSYTFQLP